MKTKFNQHGTAIFMALLITSIVATITIVLMRMQQIDIRRTQMMVTSEQAYLYSRAVIGWAASMVQENLKNPQAIPVWPIVLPSTQIDNGQAQISGILQDAQALFNLNNLTTNPNAQSGQGGVQQNPPNTGQPGAGTSQINGAMAAAGAGNGSVPGSSQASGGAISQSKTAFMNILTTLGVPMSANQQSNLVNAIVDWTSPPNPNGQNGTNTTYDPIYSQLNPPYRAPHMAMASISELRTVSGMNSVLYNALQPYIVALPISNTSINTQHAPPLILKAMGIQSPQGQGQTQAGQQTGSGQASQYFLLRADVYLSDQHFVLYTLLQNNSDPNQPLTMLWQSFGTE